jgi:acetyl-CoA acetyltransferase
MHGKPLTMERLPGLADDRRPVPRLDCCLETDGAAAYIVTTRGAGARSRQQPVYIMGAAAGQPYPADEITNRKDFHRIGLTIAAPEAFRMAGITPGCRFRADLRLLHLRGDPAARGSGFLQARRGRSLRRERRHRARRAAAGEYPRRAAVAGSSRSGIGHVVEAVRQLRGEAGARQVKDAEIGVVTGWGDFGDGSIAILRR